MKSFGQNVSYLTLCFDSNEGFPMYWRQVKPKGKQFSALEGDLNRLLTQSRWVVETLIASIYKKRYLSQKHNLSILVCLHSM